MRWWQNNCSENKKKKSFAGFVKKKCHKTFKTLSDSSFVTVGNMPTCGAAGNCRCFRLSRGWCHSSVHAWRDVANEVWHRKWAVAHFQPSGRLSAEIRWRNKRVLQVLWKRNVTKLTKLFLLLSVGEVPEQSRRTSRLVAQLSTAAAFQASRGWCHSAAWRCRCWWPYWDRRRSFSMFFEEKVLSFCTISVK